MGLINTLSISHQSPTLGYHALISSKGPVSIQRTHGTNVNPNTTKLSSNTNQSHLFPFIVKIIYTRWAMFFAIYSSRIRNLTVTRFLNRSSLLSLYSPLSFSSSNRAFMVGLPCVSFLMVRSSALLLAKRKLFTEDSSATFVF